MTSPEFRLAAHACRRTFDSSCEPEPVEKVDWTRFLNLVRRHRIQGLVYEGLRDANAQVPDATSAALGADAEVIVRTNLGIAQECARLRSRFVAAGVPLIFLKGLALAAQAYPNPFLKMGWDVDLLVRPEHLGEASQILAEAGYTTPIARNRLSRWHSRRKESTWSKNRAVHVELHTQLADNPTLLARLDAFDQPHEALLPGGILLPTLAGDELFTYLCVHGTGSVWMRLKWLADLAALLRDRDEADVKRLYRRSIALGGGRTAAVALTLAGAHFGTRVPGRLLQEFQSDRSSKALTSICANCLSGRYELDEPTQVHGGTWSIHVAQLLLAPGARFAGGEALRQAVEMLTRGADGQGPG